MRSIDKLREWANGLHGVYINQVDHTITVTTGWDAPPDMDSVSLREHVNAILDGIEREVADMVPLPLDADGEPWHINDEFEVDEGIAHVNGIGDNRLFYIDGDGMQWTRADNKCHHHAPTVEDVLREFASDIADVLGGDDFRLDDSDELFAEYAAKLRLAGDE